MYSDKIYKINELYGHNGSIYGLTYTTLDNFFYSAGGDGWIAKWQKDGLSNDGVLIAKTDTKLFCIAHHEQFDLIVAGDINGHLFWIDTANNTILKRSIAHKNSVFDIVMLDGDQMISISGDGYMTVWDIMSKLPIISIKISNQGLRCAVFDNITRLIYIGSSDNNIYNIHRDTWNIENKISHAHQNSVFTLALLNSNTLLSGGRDAHLKVRNLSNPKELSVDLAAHWYTINKIIYLPEINMIATASRDKTFRLWDDRSFEPIMTIDVFKGGHHHSINTLLWMPKNNILATAGDDRVIKLWKVDHL